MTRIMLGLKHLQGEFPVSILPDQHASTFTKTQAVSIKLGNAYQQANFCTFALDGTKKIPHKRDGSMGVARDTPADNLYNTDDVWAMEEMPHGQYFGLVLQKAAAIPGKGHLVVLDVDLKHSQTTTNMAITKMARWVKANKALTEISVSGKGRHIFLIANQAEGILPKYKLAAGQEVEVFGLDNSAGKSVLLSGDQLTGDLIEVPDLHALLSEWGIIEQHQLNQPAPPAVPTQAIDFSPILKREQKEATHHVVSAVSHAADMARASSALSSIVLSKGDYDLWINMGMALQEGFGDAGFHLWDSWSSSQYEYEGTEALQKKWRGFHNGDGVTMGTLFHTAKQAGWEPPNKTSERKTAIEDFQSLIKQSTDAPAPYQPESLLPLNALQGWPELELDITKLEPIDYLIQGFWAHSFFVLAGQPGIGKTTAVMSACMVMAGFSIRDCALKSPQRRKTIFVTEDSDQIKRTLYAYSKHFHIAPQELLHWFVVIDAKRSDVKDLLTLSHNIIRHTVDGVRPHLVLDTANSTMEIDNENDNSEVGAFLAALKQTIYVQLKAPITVITHTNKTISRQDSDATARGASAFTGDATLTGILFMDEDGTRYMKLTKTRYEPDFREIRFDSELFPETVIDRHGQPQTMLCRVAIAHESSEDNRRQSQASKSEERASQRVQDACDEACNYVQSVLNRYQDKVIMRRGPGKFKVPNDMADHYQLTWDELYLAVPAADQGNARRAVGVAIFTRFADQSDQSGWVKLVG